MKENLKLLGASLLADRIYYETRINADVVGRYALNYVAHSFFFSFLNSG